MSLGIIVARSILQPTKAAIAKSAADVIEQHAILFIRDSF